MDLRRINNESIVFWQHEIFLYTTTGKMNQLAFSFKQIARDVLEVKKKEPQILICNPDMLETMYKELSDRTMKRKKIVKKRKK